MNNPLRDIVNETKPTITSAEKSSNPLRDIINRTEQPTATENPLRKIITDTSLIDKVIRATDILRRGETAPAAMALIKGENPLRAYISGVIGKTPEYRIGYAEVIKELGDRDVSKNILDNPTFQNWVGLLLDIGLDPTTYLTGGLTSKGKIAQKVGLIGTKAQQAARGERALLKFVGKPILPKAVSVAGYKGMGVIKEAVKGTGIGQTITKVFKGVDNDQLKNLIALNRASRENITNKAYADAYKYVTKRLKALPKGVGAQITNAVEMASKDPIAISKLAVISPDAVDIAKFLKSNYAEMLKIEQSMGLGTKALGDELGYVLHIMHPKAKKEIEKFLNTKKTGYGLSKVFNPKNESQLMRKIQDVGVEEINKMAKAGKLTELGVDLPFKFKSDFFVTDPAYALAKRGERFAKSISNQQFLDKTAKLFGKTVDEAPEGFRAITMKVAEGARNPLAGLKFDPVVANEIEKTISKLTDVKEIKGFLKIFDNVQNIWKSWTLAYFPSYYIRNIAGNTWNNYLAGVVDPRVYFEAGKMQRLGKIGKLEGKELEVYNKAWDMGILGRGGFAADIPTERALKPTVFQKTIGRENPIMKKGFAFGRTTENNARLAHFIDKVKKGFSYEESAKSVKKYLFDYGDLTETERLVFKRLFPFFTWTRKNLPLQIEEIIKQPGKFAAVEKTRKAIAGGEEPERKYIPDWLKEQYGFRVGKTKDGVSKYFPLASWLPAADLVKLLRPTDIPEQLLTPLIKTLVELKQNRSVFYKKPIESYKGQRKELLGMSLPSKLEYVMRQIRVFNELDRLFGTKSKGLTEYEIAIRGLTGIKFMPVDIKNAKYYYYKEKKKLIQDIKYDYRKALKSGNKNEAKRLLELMRETGIK